MDLASEPSRRAAGRPLARVMLGLSTLIDRVNAGLAVVADYMVLAACLVSAGNAASRYLFSISGNAWLELQWQMFSVMVLLGASYTLKRNEHVRVDILYASLSDRGRLWIDILGLVFFLLPATSILAYLSWSFAMISLAGNEQSVNAGGLPLWPVKLFMPLGFFMLTLQGVSELIKRIAALRGTIELDAHYEKPLQ